MCIGPLKKICHWGPITACIIITIVTLMTIRACNIWWPPYNSVGGFLNKIIFLIFCGLALYNMMSAIFHGPGFVPLKWVPEDARDEAYLQFCKVCQGFKAPRSHHCRKCGRCVMKMDHHCPWINNCVGFLNHRHFTSFLLFAVIGCTHSSVILTCTLFTALQSQIKIQYVHGGLQHSYYFTLCSLVFTIFALGLSIGVVIAVGMLFCFQLRSILRNKTAIEEWIVQKAVHRRGCDNPPFVYPYDLGWRRNLAEFLNVGGSCKSDGTNWPVAEGCNQYSLTIEQKDQKGEKRQRSRLYSVVHRYNGRLFPVMFGWGTFLNIPFTDEARITLEPGDSIVVTRWRRNWLFGERTSSKDGNKARGWFPQCCSVEISSYPQESNLDDCIDTEASIKKDQ